MTTSRDCMTVYKILGGMARWHVPRAGRLYGRYVIARRTEDAIGDSEKTFFAHGK